MWEGCFIFLGGAIVQKEVFIKILWRAGEQSFSVYRTLSYHWIIISSNNTKPTSTCGAKLTLKIKSYKIQCKLNRQGNGLLKYLALEQPCSPATTCDMSSGVVRRKGHSLPSSAMLLAVSADFMVLDGDEPGAVLILAASAWCNFTRDVFFQPQKVQIMYLRKHA